MQPRKSGQPHKGWKSSAAETVAVPRRSMFDYPGRIMSGSKTGPKGHVCVWNANVLTKSRGKFWFGDLDLTDDADELKALAAKEGEPVYILREMDCRFTTEADPKWDAAVAIVTPAGEIDIRDNR